MMIFDAAQSLDWTNAVQTGGTVGLLILVVFCLLTRRIVPGWTYDAMEKERDYYRDLANRGTDIAARQMNVAEVLTDRLGQSEALEREARLMMRREVLRRDSDDQ